VTTPVSANVSTATGAATAVTGQYRPPSGQDGHFVIFDNETARGHMLGFLESLLADGIPTIE
jgi:hypothetical protein